ncbi:hypothetical protein SAMD00019534_097710, partial [Acytostelium subglobosum LB1]|uniref:hypothetical protein n=1 Tax=Acytostelium subglobosum LB1 TaxID=1410327 RepID=UPI000644A852
MMMMTFTRVSNSRPLLSTVALLNSCGNSRLYTTSGVSAHLPSHNRDKKILIHGTDATGVSLALFLKRRGISSELVDTGSPSTRSDRGMIIGGNEIRALKQNGVFESIYRKSKDISSSVVASRDGDVYGQCQFEKCLPTLPFALTESTYVETLLQECLSTPQSGEGIVKLRRGETKLTLQQPKNQQVSTTNNKIFVSYSETSKAAYDLVVGCDPHSNSNDIQSVSPVRSYMLRDATPNNIAEQYPEQLYHFRTVINRPQLFPSIAMQQFATEKRLLTFPLPNDRLAVSGSFKKPLQSSPVGDVPRNKIFQTFLDFEDIGAHIITEFLESAPESLKLEKTESNRLVSYISSAGNVVVIGEAADRLAGGSFESNFIGIEDAYQLAELISGSPTSVDQLMVLFNQQRQTRIKSILETINHQEHIVYKGGWQVRLFGKYYLRRYFSQRSQSKRIRQITGSN